MFYVEAKHMLKLNIDKNALCFTRIIIFILRLNFSIILQHRCSTDWPGLSDVEPDCEGLFKRVAVWLHGDVGGDECGVRKTTGGPERIAFCRRPTGKNHFYKEAVFCMHKNIRENF